MVLQLVRRRGGPSCCNMNRGPRQQLWPERGENIEKAPTHAFTYRGDVYTAGGIAEQTTTAAPLISAKH